MTKKKQDHEIIERNLTAYLPVKISRERRVELGETLGIAVDQLKNVEHMKAQVMKEYNESIKAVRGEVDQISEVMKNGEEERRVDCVDLYDLKENSVRRVRKDNGKEVWTRALTPEETDQVAQMEIPTAEG